jgi:hypothetical protein
MKTESKPEPRKKEKKIHQKGKSSQRRLKDSKSTTPVDTDFHHIHPFREQ